MAANWRDDDSTFNLIIYSVPPGYAAKGVEQNDIPGWLTEYGTLCSGRTNPRRILDKYAELSQKPLAKDETPTDAAISFPRGKLFSFFKCARRSLGVDLLPLIGGSEEEASEMEEEDLCLGSLQHEIVNVVVIKVRTLLEFNASSDSAKEDLDEEDSKRKARIEELRKHAKQHNLDPDWYVESLARLADALEQSVNVHEENLTMGLLE
eukprot:TRINITY_DN8408_c0_g1_i1.p1 TRINITY_DN8408_c0_g1~~TRINITY_DN8408_c0_g1_i1.p1  ORF type:complete len:234 (-),score=62.11 TRINITY_DN8408_c0_g1_i1:54-677(-)